MTLDVTRDCSRITGLYLQKVTSSATTTLTHTTYTAGCRLLSGISVLYGCIAILGNSWLPRQQHEIDICST